MTRQGNTSSSLLDEGIVQIAMTLLAIALLGWTAWYYMHTDLVFYGLEFAYWELRGVALLPNALVGALPLTNWLQQIAQLAGQARWVPFPVLAHWMSLAGLFYTWVPMLGWLWLLRRSVRHPALHTRRAVTAKSLPHITSTFAPAIIPVLQYGDLLNTDPIEQASSQSLEEWLVEHALLAGGYLRKPSTLRVLTQQLGEPLPELAAMTPPGRALFTVFGLALENRADEAWALVDALNRSCATGTYQGRPGYPDLTLADPAYAQLSPLSTFQERIKWFRYERTLLRGMYVDVQEILILPSSNLRWLKGMDRVLWYTLNGVGRKTSWVECLGPYTQERWERYARAYGLPLEKPWLADAVNAIEDECVLLGIAKRDALTQSTTEIDSET